MRAKQPYVGRSVKRLEDRRLLTGQGCFVDDIRLPGTMHIAFLRSDHAHARIVRIDVAAARSSPGVFAVVCAEDIVGDWREIVATSRMRNFQPTAMPLLAAAKVRFVGEAVVAVLAENRYLAEDAARLIEIDYEELPPLSDPETALCPDAVLLHEGLTSNVLVEREFARGEPEAAFWQPALHLKERFRMHRKTPLALENRTYLADYQAGQRSLTLHTSSQVPGIIRDALAKALDIPGSHLRVVAPDVGGGFGGKTSLYPEEVLVCVLSRRFGCPVKWTSDRLEDLLATSQGFDEIVDAELAVDASGRFLALKAEVIGDVGAYSVYPWTAGIEPVQVASFLPGPYKIEHYRARVRALATAKPPLGPYRGVGRPIATFVMERLVDMAAARLGLDPVELRRRNLVQADEFPYKTGSGIEWRRSGFLENLGGACDAIGYETLRREQQQARDQGRLVGIGIACFAELTGIGSRLSASPGMPINTGTETATVNLDATGAFTARFGVTSYGQGLETALAQVVADELQVDIERLRVRLGDTDQVGHGTGSYASRGAVLGAGAAMLACRALLCKLRRVAALLMQAEANEVALADGRFVVRDGSASLSYQTLAHTYYSHMGAIPADVRNHLGDLSATRVYDPEWGTTSSATHIAQVEIDRATLRVSTQRYVVAEDCGQRLNPMIVDGQIHGGVAQGIGAALYEEMIHDEQGQVLTASLADYVVPSSTEVPRIETVHLELEKPTTLGKLRGMGEGGTIGAPAAIANAVSDALAPLGKGVNTLPITPERIFQLLR